MRARIVMGRGAFARHLAALFLASNWDVISLADTAGDDLGLGRTEALVGLVGDIHARVETPYAPPPKALASLVRSSRHFDALHLSFRKLGREALPVLAPARMAPLAPFDGLSLPALAAPRALADWLGVSPGHLDWFADLSGRAARAEDSRLRHYRTLWIPK